ncbi:MAG: ferritin family protein [Eubacteriales bacterium]
MYDNELQILKTAIINETEGFEFYTLAAKQVEDPNVKEALSFLAHEEEQHKSWLLNIYQSLSKHGLSELKQTGTPGSPGIFELGKVRPESGSLEVSVFRIGILMEKASQDFYRQAAAESRVEEVKNLCSHLADWEGEHLKMLEKTYDYLKEEWWDKQGFSPA